MNKTPLQEVAGTGGFNAWKFDITPQHNLLCYGFNGAGTNSASPDPV